MNCSVVWPYLASAATSDELRYSLRSVAAHVSGVRNVVVCGDKPAWYRGDFVPSPKRAIGRWSKWVDSFDKLQAMIDSPLISDRFLWMYDDTFILRPTSTYALSVPRFQGQLCQGKVPTSDWQQGRSNTARVLQERGLPTRNYSTHYVTTYEKHKLQRVLDEYRNQQPLLIESLYLNQADADSQPIGNMLQYIRKPASDWRTSFATVLNLGAFSGEPAAAIRNQFRKRCSQEPAPINCVHRGEEVDRVQCEYG